MTTIPPRTQAAIDLYETGLSLKQIAIQLGVSPATVQRDLKLANYTTRPSGGRVTFDAEKAVEMWKAGETLDAIAAAMSVNRNAVYEQLKKFKIDTSARWHINKDVVADKVAAGASDCEIAEDLNKSAIQVARIRREDLGVYSPSTIKTQSEQQAIEEFLSDSSKTFDDLRDALPDVRYGSLVTGFQRCRPGEWEPLIQSREMVRAAIAANKSQIVADLNAHRSVSAIAAQYNIPSIHLTAIVEEMGIDYNPILADIPADVRTLLESREWCEQVIRQNPRIGYAGIAFTTLEGKVGPHTVKRYFTLHGLEVWDRDMYAMFPQLADVEWLKEQYATKSQEQIGLEIGVSHPTVRSALERAGIEIKREFQVSKIEKQLVADIKKFYSGPIIENDRSIIAPKELDIVFPELKIAIEVCGMYWHSELYKENNYHLTKLKAANAAGYRLVTVFEDELDHKRDVVMRKLRAILGRGNSERVYARRCVIKEIDAPTTTKFLNENHIQGAMGAATRLGAFADNKLVAVMTFRTMDDEVKELSRFATSVQVVGGFSKLLKHYRTNYSHSKIITFADRRWSSMESNVYVTNGFKEVGVTPISYSYYDNAKKKRIHRVAFQKHKLADILKVFDPELTERQNANNNGFFAVYDCGHIKYELENPNSTTV